jgi:hypothetical protein
MRNGRIIPLPVAELRHTRDRFAYTDKTETFPDALGLPRTVELFTSRSLYRSSQDDFDNESSFGDRYAAWKKKSVASLEEGVRTFQYSVLESTNVFGRTFPIKFEFFQKGRAYEQNGNWFCRGIGSVKSIRPSARPEGLFVPSLQQTIVDYRFRDPTGKVRSIVYTSTNASASPIDDPELQRKFRASVERMQRPKTGAK